MDTNNISLETMSKNVKLERIKDLEFPFFNGKNIMYVNVYDYLKNLDNIELITDKDKLVYGKHFLTYIQKPFNEEQRLFGSIKIITNLNISKTSIDHPLRLVKKQDASIKGILLSKEYQKMEEESILLQNDPVKLAEWLENEENFGSMELVNTFYELGYKNLLEYGKYEKKEKEDAFKRIKNSVKQLTK